MNFEIRAVNTKYDNGEVTGVKISYSAKNETRSVNVSGVFELTAAEYNDNSSIGALETKAQQHLLDEINAD
ncbi:hypothetical protein SAMN04487943_101293 [Gracilibacillus orientalis]|uniref:Uncharacterized protein n=1 Tax=Gracilibacillus orientalis TaxID=334253 RepID=A0A1I4HB86_9BACI|nr:hypothetical protein [Gracilibacillus orientalis]SFL38691.1 hypothetical protein SAMN04487943_101293 [Gracilibacillus orientalis]